MAYKKTHRVRRRTKYQKRRSLKRKSVKSIKGTKRRGGGPGDLPGVDDLEDYYKNQALGYKDRDFTISRGGTLESGWKIDVHYGNPVVRVERSEPPKIVMSKPTIGGLGVYVSFEELVKNNNWFKITPPSLGSSAKP